MFRGMWKDETGIGIQWGLHKAMAIRPVAGRSPFVRQASVWPELTSQPLTPDHLQHGVLHAPG